MTQPALFDDFDTVPSPICVYDGRCPRQGRASIGPRVQVTENCENQTVLCFTCKRHGTLSHNLTVGR